MGILVSSGNALMTQIQWHRIHYFFCKISAEVAKESLHCILTKISNFWTFDANSIDEDKSVIKSAKSI